MDDYYSEGGWVLTRREDGWEIYPGWEGYAMGRSRTAWEAIKHSGAPLETNIALICEIMHKQEETDNEHE